MAKPVRNPPPNALDRWQEIAGRFAGRRPAVFLDYDGTLTPIVDHAEHAILSEGMRQTLCRLAKVHPTTLVSGRARADVAALVGLDELRYVGCHGFDMSGHGHPDPLFGSPEEMISVVRLAAAELRERTASIPGVVVEDKTLALALHFRRVPTEFVDELLRIGREVLAGQPRLRQRTGKKVIDIVPALEWNKGHAVLRVLSELARDGVEPVPLYIGDDTTDEDAFLAIAGRGIGVVVGGPPKLTAAGYSVQGVSEVEELLSRICKLQVPAAAGS